MANEKITAVRVQRSAILSRKALLRSYMEPLGVSLGRGEPILIYCFTSGRILAPIFSIVHVSVFPMSAEQGSAFPILVGQGRVFPIPVKNVFRQTRNLRVD